MKQDSQNTPSRSRWKSTDKILPNEGATVLCWFGPGDTHPEQCYAVATYARVGYWHNPEDDEDGYRDPDYWMPLPASPEET